MAAGSAAVYSLGFEGMREYAGLGQPSLWPSNARGGGAVELVKGPKTLTSFLGSVHQPWPGSSVGLVWSR